MDWSMQSDFLFNTQVTGRALTLTLSGELDLLSAPALGEALDRLFESETECELVIVDLRGLEFIDSTGLHVLIEAHQRLHDAGRRLALVKGSDQIQRLFELTGVTDALTIVDSPDQLFEVDQAS
jgi:anti-sigma B factor antagonist